MRRAGEIVKMSPVEKHETPLTEVELCRAKSNDLPEILALLDACQLPKEELAPHLSTALIARRGNEIVGSSVLELYQQHALLRSVAVEPSFRKKGLGVMLTREALNLAREFEVMNVYLLTDTASSFFSKLGFIPISRSDVPGAVKQSVEFTTVCPESATVMTISLPP